MLEVVAWINGWGAIAIKHDIFLVCVCVVCVGRRDRAGKVEVKFTLNTP